MVEGEKYQGGPSVLVASLRMNEVDRVEVVLD
jgi:hypothetical protein